MNNMFEYIDGSYIRVTLAKRSNVNLDLMYLFIVIAASDYAYLVNKLILNLASTVKENKIFNIISIKMHQETKK